MQFWFLIKYCLPLNWRIPRSKRLARSRIEEFISGKVVYRKNQINEREKNIERDFTNTYKLHLKKSNEHKKCCGKNLSLNTFFLRHKFISVFFCIIIWLNVAETKCTKEIFSCVNFQSFFSRSKKWINSFTQLLPGVRKMSYRVAFFSFSSRQIFFFSFQSCEKIKLVFWVLYVPLRSAPAVEIS